MTKLYAGLIGGLLLLASFSGSLAAKTSKSGTMPEQEALKIPTDAKSLFSTLSTAPMKGDDAAVAEAIPTIIAEFDNNTTVNTPESSNNKPLLYYAAVNNWPLTCKALLQMGADLLGNVSDSAGAKFTPTIGSFTLLSNTSAANVIGLSFVPTKFTLLSSLTKAFPKSSAGKVITDTANLFLSTATVPKKGLSTNAVVKAVDPAGNTPLFCQAAVGNAKMCSAIITAFGKAAADDANTKNKAGFTALDVAILLKKDAAAGALIKAGGLTKDLLDLSSETSSVSFDASSVLQKESAKQ